MGETIFEYHQKDNILTSEYKGAQIVKEHLLGMVDKVGNIDMRYHQLNTKGKLLKEVCNSRPVILSNGKIRL